MHSGAYRLSLRVGRDGRAGKPDYPPTPLSCVRHFETPDVHTPRRGYGCLGNRRRPPHVSSSSPRLITPCSGHGGDRLGVMRVSCRPRRHLRDSLTGPGLTARPLSRAVLAEPLAQRLSQPRHPQAPEPLRRPQRVTVPARAKTPRCNAILSLSEDTLGAMHPPQPPVDRAGAACDAVLSARLAASGPSPNALRLPGPNPNPVETGSSLPSSGTVAPTACLPSGVIAICVAFTSGFDSPLSPHLRHPVGPS